MAAYVGLHEQIRTNNFRSTLILAGFPILVLAAVYAFFFFTLGGVDRMQDVNKQFLITIPFVIGGVGIWFLIAYYANAAMIRFATKSRPLERKENMRV